MLFALFLALVFLAIWTAVPRIETDLTARARAVVQARNLDFVRVFADGRDLYMSGWAPTEADRRSVVDAVGRLSGVRRVVDALQVDGVPAQASVRLPGSPPVEFAAAARASAEVVAAASRCKELIERRVGKQPVRFHPASERLWKASHGLLKEVAAIMGHCPKTSIEVRVHADEVEDVRANATLSRARAEAVVNHLVDAGVEARRLKARGFGRRTTGHSDQARRVEFVVRPKG